MMTFEDYLKTEEAKKMIAKVKRQLKNRGFNIENLDEADLTDEIENAIEAVNERRHFISTDQQLFENKYKGIVVRLVISSFSKMGAEGQLSHSENGVSRTYSGASEYPNDILQEIVPLGRIKEL